jgi:uncharacterized protein YyaL (SSP411 family)
MIPEIKLDHFKSLTDDTGILQHAKYSIANRQMNYTTDDNARALIVCLNYLQLNDDPEVDKLTRTYLSFLYHMQKPEGLFHNLLSYNRTFLDDIGSEDCMGRVLWACGYTLKTNISEEYNRLSKEIFDRLIQHAFKFNSIRAKAFTILSLANYHQVFPQDQMCLEKTDLLSEQLLEQYEKESSPNWKWFESILTYCNARLPQALFKAYETTKERKYLNIAKESFDFILETQMINQIFVPIGNNGWYKKERKRAIYDQQSIETSCMIETSLLAHLLTGDKKYRRIAYKIFEWFLGKNTKSVNVYNRETGACYDGVTQEGLNLNQGAESIIAYLIARLKLELNSTNSLS